jgi:hypothetical protein
MTPSIELTEADLRYRNPSINHAVDQAVELHSATTDDSSVIDKLEHYLREWYSSISPRYVDIVSDFAGQEFFLLDGEALVQSIFSDPMLDLGGSKGG